MGSFDGRRCGLLPNYCIHLSGVDTAGTRGSACRTGCVSGSRARRTATAVCDTTSATRRPTSASTAGSIAEAAVRTPREVVLVVLRRLLVWVDVYVRARVLSPLSVLRATRHGQTSAATTATSDVSRETKRSRHRPRPMFRPGDRPRPKLWPPGRSRDQNSGIDTELKRLVSRLRPRSRFWC